MLHIYFQHLIILFITRRTLNCPSKFYQHLYLLPLTICYNIFGLIYDADTGNFMLFVISEL